MKHALPCAGSAALCAGASCAGRGRRRGPAHRVLAAWSAVVLGAALLGSCASGAPPPGARAPPPAAKAGSHVPVGVLDAGWHTELILPAAVLNPSLAPLRHLIPGARYLAFGWGNRDFYMASRPGPETAVAALFPSSSVILVQGFPAQVPTLASAGADLRWLCVSPAGLRDLDAYVASYLRKGPAGAPVDLGAGPVPHSRFFASTGTYDAFHTCNTWTAAALHVAGLPVTARGVVFAGQLMPQLRSLRSCPVGSAGGSASVRGW